MTPQEKRYRDTICNMLGVPPEANPDELRVAKGIIMVISSAAPDKETVEITLAAMDLLIETAGQPMEHLYVAGQIVLDEKGTYDGEKWVPTPKANWYGTGNVGDNLYVLVVSNG
jgi:hypothetical protein